MRVLLTLVALYISFSTSDAAARLVCLDVFNQKNQIHVVPTPEELANGLKLLSEAEAPFFYVSSWGGPDQMNEKPDIYGVGNSLQDSFSRPVPFYNKENERAGGIGAFQGHIFPEGYYRTQAKPLKDLIPKQPWLEWNSISRKYTLRHGKMARVLLKPWIKDGKIKLYRGLTSRDLQETLAARDGGENEMQRLFSHRDALFFSPDKRAMTLWATKGSYIELTLSISELDRIYVGIEFDYVEVALPPEVTKRALKTLVTTNNHQAPD